MCAQTTAPELPGRARLEVLLPSARQSAASPALELCSDPSGSAQVLLPVPAWPRPRAQPPAGPGTICIWAGPGQLSTHSSSHAQPVPS